MQQNDCWIRLLQSQSMKCALTITLRDVARAAGVSTASASRALARPEAVSEELRGRILAAAGRLGYAPNLAARALVAGRSGLVAMLVDTLIEPLAAAPGRPRCSARLARRGYSLIIATTGGVHEEALARAREVLGRGVEALISWNMADTAGLAEAVAAYGVPWLAFDEPDRVDPPSRRQAGAAAGPSSVPLPANPGTRTLRGGRSPGVQASGGGSRGSRGCRGDAPGDGRCCARSGPGRRSGCRRPVARKWTGDRDVLRERPVGHGCLCANAAPTAFRFPTRFRSWVSGDSPCWRVAPHQR